jgi:hypothetical protein
LRKLRSLMSDEEFETNWQCGAALRHEDATNEALALLRAYSQGIAVNEGLAGANRPAGS